MNMVKVVDGGSKGGSSGSWKRKRREKEPAQLGNGFVDAS